MDLEADVQSSGDGILFPDERALGKLVVKLRLITVPQHCQDRLSTSAQCCKVIVQLWSQM